MVHRLPKTLRLSLRDNANHAFTYEIPTGFTDPC
jgi:hypothetical protein